MSVIVKAAGQIRTVRELRRKEPDERGNRSVFGREFSVLTDAPGHLGETLAVTVFSQDLVEIPKETQKPGARVDWVIEVKASPYGLRAVYKGPGDVLPLELPEFDELAAAAA